MKEVRNLTCIRCPMGCSLEVTLEDGAESVVTGNNCPRGREYGISEVTHPMRTLTSTVRVEGGVRCVVSCKTKGEIPKELLFPVMEHVNRIVLKAPVAIGDVIEVNIAGAGADLVATASVRSL